MKNILILFIFTTILSACSTAVSLKYRGEKKDLYLDSKNYKKLKGTFLNAPADTFSSSPALLDDCGKDDLLKRKNLTVELDPVSSRRIKFDLYGNDGKLLSSIKIKGKYKNGYFKVKPQWRKDFDIGPLLWTMEDHTKYIGLTKENKLVIIRADAAWYYFILAIPIYADGNNGQKENEYMQE